MCFIQPYRYTCGHEVHVLERCEGPKVTHTAMSDLEKPAACLNPSRVKPECKKQPENVETICRFCRNHEDMADKEMVKVGEADKIPIDANCENDIARSSLWARVWRGRKSLTGGMR
jgi:hypothetical protein